MSKGRYINGLTTKALHTMGINHYIVIEEQEYDLYNENKNASAELIILPKKYLEEYDTCDNLGFEKSKGPRFEDTHITNLDISAKLAPLPPRRSRIEAAPSVLPAPKRYTYLRGMVFTC